MLFRSLQADEDSPITLLTRVLMATDFLAARGLGPFSAEREFAVRWVAAAGALLIEGLATPSG